MSRPGIRVYDERGDLYANSVTEAIVRLGLSRTCNLHDAGFVRPYLDGYQLVRRPTHAGQHGGARPRRIPPAPLCTVCGERAARSTARTSRGARCHRRYAARMYHRERSKRSA